MLRVLYFYIYLHIFQVVVAFLGLQDVYFLEYHLGVINLVSPAQISSFIALLGF